MMSLGKTIETLDREVALEFIKKSIRACAERGEDREAECLELARVNGIDEEKVQLGFVEARAERTALEDAGEISLEVGQSAAVEEASLEQTGNAQKGPAVEPEVAKPAIVGIKLKVLEPRASTGAVLTHELGLTGGGLTAEPEVETRAEEAFEEPQEEPEPLPVLDRKAPLEAAWAFCKARYWVEGVLTLRRQQGEFYKWNGRCYEAADPGSLRAELYEFLATAEMACGGGVIRIQPDAALVSKIMDALEAVVAIMPSWWPQRGLAVRPRLRTYGSSWHVRTDCSTCLTGAYCRIIPGFGHIMLSTSSMTRGRNVRGGTGFSEKYSRGIRRASILCKR